MSINFSISQPENTNLTKWQQWFTRGERLDEQSGHYHAAKPWWMVLWLTGVDYFSTLGYQPGIALLAAGALAPLATAILVLVTLLCALPVYSAVARRSFAGQGSIAILENLLKGWKGKISILVLLGFAATDFIVTMTLSAADATHHIIENPYVIELLGSPHWLKIPLTIFLLAMLTLIFIKGFVEAIEVASAVAIPYIILNFIVLGRGLLEIIQDPTLHANWTQAFYAQGSWPSLILSSFIIFPQLALGMSGFETGVSVMPLVKGASRDKLSKAPLGRIENTKKLLMAAALIMCTLLMISAYVTAVLIPEVDYKSGGPAAGRAIAYLAHKYMGPIFGTTYDISTILILWFAGASAMAGLLNLIPRYLPRFGLAPRWVVFARPLIVAIFIVDLLVTILFKADVEAQAGAYATGVLVLMVSAAISVAMTLRIESKKAIENPIRPRIQSILFFGVAGALGYTLIENIIERPDGVLIASIFVVSIITFSVISRAIRSIELRVSDLHFADTLSSELWGSIRGKKVHLVPLRTSSPEARAKKTAEIRKYYSVTGPIAFIHVNMLDNRSEFIAPLEVRVIPENENFVVEVNRAIAIANSIAYISECIDPVGIFLGLTRQNLVTQSLRYLFWGEGETGLMVYAILLRFWSVTPDDDVRPLIFLMSE